MKYLLLMAFSGISLININAQRYVYDTENERRLYKKEKVTLDFIESQNRIARTDTSLLAQHRHTNNGIYSRNTNLSITGLREKYVKSYSFNNSYLHPEHQTLPNVIAERTIQINNKHETAIKIYLKTKKIENLDAFYYYVDSIELYHSKAGTVYEDDMFDYFIEVKPSFLVEDIIISKLSQPIYLSSINFGSHKFKENEYRSDLIPVEKGSAFVGLSIRIIEFNSAKIDAGEILDPYGNRAKQIESILNYIASDCN